MRSLMTEFPKDGTALPVCDSFMFGCALLVKPVTRPMNEGGNRTEVYLPAGYNWYDWHTGGYYAGGQTVSVDTPLEKIPVFVKAGSIVPLSKGGSNERAIAPLADELAVYTGCNGEATLYGDAGDGYEYETDEYTLIRLIWNENAATLTLRAAEGSAGFTAHLTIRFIAPDGMQTLHSVEYLGDEINVNKNKG